MFIFVMLSFFTSALLCNFIHHQQVMAPHALLQQQPTFNFSYWQAILQVSSEKWIIVSPLLPLIDNLSFSTCKVSTYPPSFSLSLFCASVFLAHFLSRVYLPQLLGHRQLLSAARASAVVLCVSASSSTSAATQTTLARQLNFPLTFVLLPSR